MPKANRVGQPALMSHVTLWHYNAIAPLGGLMQTLQSSSVYHGFYARQATGTDGDSCYHPVYLKAGSYTLRLVNLKYNNCGKMQLKLQHQKYGNTDLDQLFDTYSSTLVINNIEEINPVTVTRDGYHYLWVIANGKNASSSAYFVNVTAVHLIRNAD